MKDNQNTEWDISFKNKDNYLFYPHEEVIRFISKYVIKRIGFDEYKPIMPIRKMLDLGCGIGRHVIYGCENNIDSYGIDLSEEAINYAKKYATDRKIDTVDERFVVGDIRKLPWDDGLFNIVVSHGVLDSMSFDIAKAGVKELHRVTSDGAMFYCDLICDPEDGIDNEGVVEASHEHGTIQSYFTGKKIDELFLNCFTLVEKVKVIRQNHTADFTTARWHLVLKRV